MDTLLPVSMLIATLVVPALAARVRSPRRALTWTLLVLVAFTLAYAVVLTRVYARLHVPEPFQP